MVAWGCAGPFRGPLRGGRRRSVVAERVHPVRAALPRLADPDLEVVMRTGGPSALADSADLLALRHRLTGSDQHRRHVVMAAVDPATVVDPDLVPAAVVLPAGKDDHTVTRGHDRAPVVVRDVDAVVAVVEVLADIAAGNRPRPRAAGRDERAAAAAA